ncbi:hypothetical protein K504DRAFT_175011 [Pleomassaria siparia CBS 279.74]|uniref:Uncharacterized protein n=1 Tax=Pleomassaria siparia CBS 279.74 TaxID=1314801 RepID=A0A6G1JSS1_9PLEO|nr:hypothetical protein K504DRAFT_175011 [Pleomassaria siparia CBS 279.74]
MDVCSSKLRSEPSPLGTAYLHKHRLTDFPLVLCHLSAFGFVCLSMESLSLQSFLPRQIHTQKTCEACEGSPDPAYPSRH